ncbi:MAG: twin-arginine translocase subunit TatC [Tepidisphaeraceae bacterium]|jgi:sec-independent protein translocase protein TatC
MPPDASDFDPTQFQMSIGDHLEELRRRILLALLGIAVVGVGCLAVGQRLVGIFCRPLFDALQKSDLNPQIFTEQLADGFMVYLKISLIVAAALASPWVIYQLWQFVSAGLYPHERRAVTRYIPLSIVLMISGMLFVYFLVLPWSLQFFIRFTVGIPLPPLTHNYSGTPDATQPSFVQTLSGDPDRPVEGRFWFDASENRLKMFSGGRIRVIPFGSDSLLSTHFTLPDYVDLVLQLLLTFGLAFQLPLVVMALAKLGIVDIDTLKLWRRYVYFALCVIAAALAPGDVVTATIALMIPLILLYELGIFLAKLNPRKVD